MADIFVSYASEDLDRIMPVVRALEATGWSLFWDRTIPVGGTWQQVIGAEIETCRCMVVIWSAISIKKEWVYEEATEGKRRGVLAPVLIDDILPPIGFRSIQAAKLKGWDGKAPSAEFDRLLKDLSRILGTPPTEVREEQKRQADQKAARQAELNAAYAREQADKEAQEQKRQEEEAKRRAEEEAQRKAEERRKAGEDSQRLEIILTALLEALANLGETVVKDTYSAIKTLICRKYGEKSKLAEALEQLEKSPDAAEGRAELAEQLKAAKADQDDSVVNAAQDLTAKIRALQGVQQNIRQTVSGNHNIFSGSGNVTVTLNGKAK